MPRFLLGKLARGVITLWLVVTFAFVVLRVAGDPLDLLLPDDALPDTIETYRILWGLDRPLWEQYLRYAASVVHGDLGQSFRDGRDALDVVLERVPATLQLGSLALGLSLLIGIPLGVTAAVKRNSPVDRLAMSFAVFGYSMPNFFLGILMILVFALHWRVLPSSGSTGPEHLVMPVVTLGTAIAGTIARFTRSAMLEVLSQPYMRTARAKGVPWFRAMHWHAMPNAAIPTITILGMEIGKLIGGALITETVFAWPGVGRLLVASVGQRDLAVVQVVVLMIAFTMVATNLVVDLLYGVLDPRVRAGGTSRR